jgi:hypothetical protein
LLKIYVLYAKNLIINAFKIKKETGIIYTLRTGMKKLYPDYKLLLKKYPQKKKCIKMKIK